MIILKILVIWFAVAWLPQIIKSLITNAKIRRKGKKAKNQDKWLYQF